MPFFSSAQRFGLQARSAAVPKQTVTFTMPNLAGNGASGIANEIFALKTITIKQFSVLLSGQGNVRVFYRSGRISSNFNQSGWTDAGSVFIGSPGLQQIPLALTIDIPANTFMSFFITSGGLSYTNGSSVGTAFASNADLEVRSGYGTGNTAPPLTSVFQPRNFNGAIQYEV